MHPNYFNRSSQYYPKDTYSYDYCLIRVTHIDFDRLNKNSSRPKIAKSILPTEQMPFSVGIPSEVGSNTNCRVAGWGKGNSGKYTLASPVVRDVELKLMSTKYCQSIVRTGTPQKERSKKCLSSPICSNRIVE